MAKTIFVITFSNPTDKVVVNSAFYSEKNAKTEFGKRKNELLKCMQDMNVLFRISANDDSCIILSTSNNEEYSVFLDSVEIN